MKFSKALINPPYKGGLGGKIINFIHALYTDTYYSVLMPVSNYKNNDLYRYVNYIETVDPHLFKDTDITKGLCICKLSSTADKYDSFIELEMKTYNPSLALFYNVNYKLPKKYIFERYDYASVEDFDFERDYIDTNRLVNWDTGFMDGGNGQGYIWNVSRRKEIIRAGLIVIKFKEPIERKNFTTWAFSDCKNGLANKIMFGLNKQTTSSLCYIAIPQIDWGNIHNTELWQKGEYDNAVLKEMGLKWSKEKTAVEYI